MIKYSMGVQLYVKKDGYSPIIHYRRVLKKVDFWVLKEKEIYDYLNQTISDPYMSINRAKISYK